LKAEILMWKSLQAIKPEIEIEFDNKSEIENMIDLLG